ncbi:MAG: hypothetical protein H7338_19760 [Candidatus Sericytochromatia bacterium]|nr:hypothetical protein [Candidatus Sericytochromatia bacterium]
MANELTTIKSLQAVDAWIDVINANINGGVRTAYKSSRLKFGGSNVNISRGGNSVSVPLQYAEPGLITSNTVIDFSQGAIVNSSSSTHLAIKGEGFFLLNSLTYSGNDHFSRDGEFHTDAKGFLCTNDGLYLFDPFVGTNPPSFVALIWNDVDQPGATAPVPPAGAPFPAVTRLSDLILYGGAGLIIVQNKPDLRFSRYGSTVYELPPGSQVKVGTSDDAAVLSKSLEASNASMTQSVPELSLAQKLFSALTKVLQISQTNTDAILNLVR